MRIAGTIQLDRVTNRSTRLQHQSTRETWRGVEIPIDIREHYDSHARTPTTLANWFYRTLTTLANWLLKKRNEYSKANRNKKRYKTRSNTKTKRK